MVSGPVLEVILLKVVAPVKVSALGAMAPLQELKVTPLEVVAPRKELKAAPLDQVVAHLEVEVEVRRLPRLREARLELALVANAFRQEWRMKRLSCTCRSHNLLDKD